MVLDSNNVEFTYNSEGDDDTNIPFVNYERDNSGKYNKGETVNIKKSDYERAFPINRTTKPKILMLWDDICIYTGIGIVLFLKEKYGLDNPFDEELYFQRGSRYSDCVDFAHAFFEDRFTKTEIETELKNNYFEIQKYSPVSNTLISVLKMINYSKSITFAFRYDCDEIPNIIKGFEKYFNVVRNNECQINYIVLDEYDFGTVMDKLCPTVVFCLDVNKYYEKVLDSKHLENIEFYGPLCHNHLSFEFKEFYFGRLNGMFLPKKCSIQLYKEQIYEVSDV